MFTHCNRAMHWIPTAGLSVLLKRQRNETIVNAEASTSGKDQGHHRLEVLSLSHHWKQTQTLHNKGLRVPVTALTRSTNLVTTSMAPVTRQSSRIKDLNQGPESPPKQEAAKTTEDKTFAVQEQPIQPPSKTATAKQAALSASANAAKRPRTTASRTAEKKLTQFHSLPEYLQDNEFITAYYRAPDQTWRASVSTLFGIHNETGNVWTHLVGACEAARARVLRACLYLCL